jgi:aerobic carbon-monoxide dehydrogenase small subunit
MLITAWDLMKIMPDPDAAAVRVAISGNLCRCTGYQGIVRSILRAAREVRTCRQREGA